MNFSDCRRPYEIALDGVKRPANSPDNYFNGLNLPSFKPEWTCFQYISWAINRIWESVSEICFTLCELEMSFQDAELSLSEPALYTEIIPLTSITLSNQKCRGKL